MKGYIFLLYIFPVIYKKILDLSAIWSYNNLVDYIGV